MALFAMPYALLHEVRRVWLGLLSGRSWSPSNASGSNDLAKCACMPLHLASACVWAEVHHRLWAS